MGSRTRVWIVLGAIAIAAAIYFMPKKAGDKKEGEKVQEATGSLPAAGIEKFIEDGKKQYTATQLTKVEELEAELKKSASPSVTTLESLGQTWDALKQPGIAAHYYEQKARIDQGEKSYINAAYRYFDAFKASADSAEKNMWVEKAIGAYTKVLELNPANLNAKTDLGICYAEGTGDPMKGIMLLREVVTEDPKHENAHLNLGFLSVKSAQYEKAMERFDKVLAINPNRIDIYIYKGETALQMGDQAKAMDYFSKFMAQSQDDAMKMQVEAYMNELKKEQ